jgi:hypothetical protein
MSTTKLSWLTTWSGETLSNKRRTKLNEVKTLLKARSTPEERHFAKFWSGFGIGPHVLWCTPQKEFHMNSEISFFVDFYIKGLKLVIEIDGSQHSNKGKQSDAWRTNLLSAHNITVLRFKNHEIDNMPVVARAIIQWVYDNSGRDTRYRVSKHLNIVQKTRPEFYNLLTGKG